MCTLGRSLLVLHACISHAGLSNGDFAKSMSTRDKLEFALLLGRHSTATVKDCQRLLRFAGTLKRLSASADEQDSRKKIRIQRKMMALCAGFNSEIHFMGLAIKVSTNGNDPTIVRIPT